MPPPSPLTAVSDLATFTLKANGNDVDQRFEIISIQVLRTVNRIPSARILVRDGSVADESFPASVASDFKAGNEIQVLAGYHGEDQPIFSGIIVKAGIQQRSSSAATFVLDCRDKAVAMTIGRHSACFTQSTDSDVMQKLIGQHGLSATVSSTSPQMEEITQFSTTDWDFLATRAEANGFVVLVKDGQVTIQAPDPSKSPVLSLTYGLDLLEFDLEEDVRTQLSSVECSAWDMKTQAMISATASIKNINSLGNDKSTTLASVTGADAYKLASTTPVPQATLTTWAQAQLIKAELSKIRGSVRFQGFSSIYPGDTIELSGLGDRFDGTAYISSITHRIEEGDWQTEAGIGLDPEWFSAQAGVTTPPAQGLLPAVHGLQIGTVKQIQEDPVGGFRVLVNLPVVAAAGNGIWARFAQPYATKNAGWFFYPEVGDEVVLAFLDADPRYPVVVGSLYSSGRTPPYTPDQKNSPKAIVSNSQIKVIFDEEKKILTLQTPGGNSIVISDDAKAITLTDQNGNSAKLSPDGIALNSASDVVIKAAQNITLQAQSGKITAKGTQGVSVSGLTVSLSADTEFSASGNATASLTSSGETKVQGSLVMIN